MARIAAVRDTLVSAIRPWSDYFPQSTKLEFIEMN
jgi:hypothetical protein